MSTAYPQTEQISSFDIKWKESERERGSVRHDICCIEFLRRVDENGKY